MAGRFVVVGAPCNGGYSGIGQLPAGGVATYLQAQPTHPQLVQPSHQPQLLYGHQQQQPVMCRGTQAVPYGGIALPPRSSLGSSSSSKCAGISQSYGLTTESPYVHSNGIYTYTATERELTCQAPSVSVVDPCPSVLKVSLDRVALHAPGAAGAFKIEVNQNQAYVFVPHSSATASVRPLPLLLVLHGRRPLHVSQKENDEYTGRYQQVAEKANAIVLMPLSTEDTWDFIINEAQTRRDLDFIAYSLNEVRRNWCVDDRRIALLGLSDGASFGLSIALSNHDVFQAALLWACGFAWPTPLRRPAPGGPRPRILWWHGTKDQVFNFEKNATPLKDSLVEAGYDVTFLPEVGGKHRAPEPPSKFIDTCCQFWADLR